MSPQLSTLASRRVILGPSATRPILPAHTRVIAAFAQRAWPIGNYSVPQYHGRNQEAQRFFSHFTRRQFRVSNSQHNQNKPWWSPSSPHYDRRITTLHMLYTLLEALHVTGFGLIVIAKSCAILDIKCLSHRINKSVKEDDQNGDLADERTTTMQRMRLMAKQWGGPLEVCDPQLWGQEVETTYPAATAHVADETMEILYHPTDKESRDSKRKDQSIIAIIDEKGTHAVESGFYRIFDTWWWPLPIFSVRITNPVTVKIDADITELVIPVYIHRDKSKASRSQATLSYRISGFVC
ncbi:hypothetical protein F5Y16DRAFT_357013 [Xylariaceae sp. FL0255]|nr:hypothetical protein F5Y16DRAFT_357013 [Xylariaceae sp. FL0255]